MSLTLVAEQRLQKTGLDTYFLVHENIFLDLYLQARLDLKKLYPHEKFFRDDLAKFLIPLLETNLSLKKHLSEFKLTNPIWIKDFADLIIDKLWDQLDG